VSKIIHPVTFVGNGFMLTNREAWAWIKIPSTNTFLRPQSEKELVPREMEGLLRAVLDEGEEEVDIHLRTVNRVFDVQKWYDELTARNAALSAPPASHELTAKAANRLDESLYLTTETYLGVKLGYRTESMMNPIKDGFSTIRKFITRAAAGQELGLDATEEAHWSNAAKAILMKVSHVVPGAEPVDATSLIWLMRKPFYLTYGCPEIDIPDDDSFGKGDIAEFTTGDMRISPRYLEISNSNPVTGRTDRFFTATVCITEFSRKMYWPETSGWADIVRDTIPNAEWSIRATLLPATTVRKHIKDNLGSIQEEISDSEQSGHDGGRRLQEQAAESTELEYQASNARMPWLQITYRIQLRAESPERLEDSVNNLKTQLRAANLTLQRPPHDQLDLLMESVPGGTWKKSLYPRRQSLSMLGGGGLLSSYQVGDEGVLGPYLGRIVVGDTPPVFFDTSRAMSLNQGPVASLSGSPGTGKQCWVAEPVATPNGWTTMGELTVGDEVFDENGKVCNVTFVTPIELKADSYRLTFSDGSIVYACGEHRWLTNTYGGRQSQKRQAQRASSRDADGLKETLTRALADADPEDVMTVAQMSHHFGLDAARLRRAAKKFPSVGVDDRGFAMFPVRDFLVSALTGRVGRTVTDDVLARISAALDSVTKGQLVSVREVSELTGLSRDFIRNYARELPVAEMGHTDTASGPKPCKLYEATALLYRTLKGASRGNGNDQRDLCVVPMVRTTKEIADTVRVQGDQRVNHSILLTKPLELPEADLPIDPYVLGVWLGDGYSRKGAFCGIDHEIAARVEATGYELVERQEKNPERIHKDFRIWRSQQLADELRALGLLQKTTIEGSRKRIPDIYLRASIAQRRDLLAGLLDTDGTVAPHGNTQFTSVNEILARQTQELALTLGYRATVTSSIKRSQNGTECLAFTVGWTSPESDFWLERKTITHKERNRNYSPERNNSRYIVAVDPVEPLPMRCITVDSPSHLYLIGENMIPTHNTFLSLTLAYQCAARGYKTIYIDPKRDAVNLGLLPNMGQVNLLDLADPGNDGILDPFRLADGVESSGLLAMEVLKTLVGNLTEERETVLANAIDQVKESDNPSLWGLTEYLSAGTPGTAEYNLGSLLKSMRQAPFGRLMFSPTMNTAKIAATDGLTVITLLGLDTPPSNLPPEDYTYDQRIGVAVMYLLTKYAYQLMESGDKNAPKALFIDEAWSVLATRSGRDLVNRWGRMGRSHNAALILVTQSVRDFTESGIANQVSTRFAFGTKDPEEYGAILDFMGVTPDPSSMGIIQQLSGPTLIGHCLMKDPLGRIGVVNIDPYRTDLREAFDTNPETRKNTEKP